MEVKKINLMGACFFCLKKANFAWCSDCEQDFIRETLRCPVCARQSHHNNICSNCLKQQPEYVSTEVLFTYQYPTNHLIKAFKFNKRPELARCFAKKLANKLLHNIEFPEVMLPVPLHRKRQRERGYNQALEIANQLSKRLGINVNSSLCSRIINTSPQSTLPMKTRRKNVKGAFCLNETPIPEHVAIVDDVITTGSTANELASLLKKAGCKHIEVWAIAKT